MHDRNPSTPDAVETSSNRSDDDGAEWFHYIPLAEQIDWIELGWRIVAPIGEYSVLGKWRGDGEPKKPDQFRYNDRRRPSQHIVGHPGVPLERA
jgi:hypothetical protein